MKTLTLIFLLILISPKAFNQNYFSDSEIKIQILQQQISPRQNDSVNLSVNDSVTGLFEQTLNHQGAFDYPFDSLKFMGKIFSDDKKLRFFSWNLPLSDGTNLYSGFILYKTEGSDFKVFRLNDHSASISNPGLEVLSANDWYGCLVYDIIDIKSSGETWYTLLGYDPDNIFTSKKLIDLLTFTNDAPVFGKPVFRLKKGIQNRVIFEYSSRVQMTLKWDSRLNMIVFDHLAPSTQAYQGNFRYYGPDFSYDGLKFMKGVWELHEDIDVRGN